MIYLRRRLISWLIIAYIKKWRKLIFLFFGIGLLVFFISRWAVSELMTSIRISNVEIIGMVGSYSVDDLPNSILYKISKGLTAVQIDGTVKGDVASSWKIEDGGKKYTFYLKEDIYFTNGKNLTSEDVKYNFADVSVERPDKYSIVYLLKDSYSPFLITLSKPIFTKGLVGVSDHKVKDLKLNGDFVEHINLESKQGDIIIYQFYPTDSSLKMAYGLGEVTKIVDLSDVKFRDTSFNDFENSKIEKRVNYRRQVTLFYNTKDSTVSSKRLRDAFSYTIPDNYEGGERSFGPFPYFSFASQNIAEERRQDLVHAKELLDSAREEGEISENMSIEIKVLLKHKTVAEKIAEIWKGLGIEANIESVDNVPSNFQIFLGEFNLPQDVDQYVLWHSGQKTNITHYANLRVDKLLEDGRKEIDFEKRRQIYTDFQKFILSDPPASFLFFPYVYDVERK